MISSGLGIGTGGHEEAHCSHGPRAVHRLLEDALILLERDQGAAIASLAHASCLLDGRGTGRAAHPDAPGGLARWQVLRVARYVETNLGSRILQKHLAAEVRLSCGHFARSFKRSFGQPPHSFVTERRIERAKILMLESQASLCDIALSCGLADQAHFSRVFRRLTGTTPLTWRRQHRGSTGRQ